MLSSFAKQVGRLPLVLAGHFPGALGTYCPVGLGGALGAVAGLLHGVPPPFPAHLTPPPKRPLLGLIPGRVFA